MIAVPLFELILNQDYLEDTSENSNSVMLPFHKMILIILITMIYRELMRAKCQANWCSNMDEQNIWSVMLVFVDVQSCHSCQIGSAQDTNKQSMMAAVTIHWGDKKMSLYYYNLELPKLSTLFHTLSVVDHLCITMFWWSGQFYVNMPLPEPKLTYCQLGP